MVQEYKGYLIAPVKNLPTSLYIATAGKGGKIPKVMEGYFTDRTTAKGVIDQYTSTKGA